MKIKHSIIIAEKQCKDMLKNKTVLIQFLLFPLINIIMEHSVTFDGLPEHFFTKMFAVMYLGMAPLTTMAAILSEEKEKNTLRALLLSNITSIEYLVGVGGYIWFVCMLGGSIFFITGNYKGYEGIVFLGSMAVGILISLLIGAVIGTWSKNQMSATSFTVPIMMVFSFLPMLSMFNETIRKVAKITYTQQISLFLNQTEPIKINIENVIVILFNILIVSILFRYAYKKYGFT